MTASSSTLGSWRWRMKRTRGELPSILRFLRAGVGFQVAAALAAVRRDRQLLAAARRDAAPETALRLPFHPGAFDVATVGRIAQEAFFHRPTAFRTTRSERHLDSPSRE